MQAIRVATVVSLLIAGFLSITTTLAAAGELLVSPGTKGTLTVEYDYSAIGKKEDKYDPKEWRVHRTIRLAADMRADKQQPLSTLRPMEADQVADIQNKQNRTASAQKKMAPMMADMEKIVVKCGDSEACIEREVKNYGLNMQMTPELTSVKDDVAAVGKQGALRYQTWKAVSQNGTYAIEESYRAQTADPICMEKPNQRCKREETRKGGGNVPAPANGKSSASTSMLEVDSVKKEMFITLPMPLNALTYTKNVVSDYADEKSGTSQGFIANFLAKVKPITVTIPQGLRSVSGTEKIQLDGAEGESGTLAIKWQFTVQ